MRIPRWLKLSEIVVAHAAWELLAMRLLFAWFVWRLLPGHVVYLTQPVPNGLGHWMDLTFLAQGEIYPLLRNVAGISLLVFAAGAVPALSLTVPTLLLIALGTLENSQGAIGHHFQLTCMVAMGQCGLYLSRASKGPKVFFWPSTDAHREAVHWAKLIIAAAYVTSACVKLIASGGLWIVQLPDISLQLVKTHANVYYDTLRPAEGWVANQLPYFISAHPNLTRIFFTPGLLLELFAFIALGGRLKALIIGGGLLAMHFLVRVVMNLSFSAHEWLLLIFLVNVPYWVWAGGRWLTAPKSA